MVDANVVPFSGMKPKRRAGQVAGETADRLTTAVVIEAMAPLATTQIIVCLGSVEGKPGIRMDGTGGRGVRIAASATCKYRQTTANHYVDDVMFHFNIPHLAMASNAVAGRLRITMTTETG